MPRLTTINAFDDEASAEDSQEVMIRSDILPQRCKSRDISGTGKKRKNLTISKPPTKKKIRRNNVMSGRSRPLLQDPPKLHGQDASESDPKISNNESLKSALEEEEMFLEPEIAESLNSSDSEADEIVRKVLSNSSSLSSSPPQAPKPSRNTTAKSRVQSDDQCRRSFFRFQVDELSNGMPIVIRRLPLLQKISIPVNPITFSKKEITSLLGRKKLSNHFWLTKDPKQGFYLIDANTQPFAPSGPGQHGAVVSWSMEATDTGKSRPLFVDNGDGYEYFGHYIEPRYSDKISYNEFESIIPDRVKEWAAKDMCGRPGGFKSKSAVVALQYQWSTTPQGWYDETTETFKKYDKAREEELGIPHFKVITDDEAQAITYKELREAFERADADDKPVFRLWWEYLQCVEFDKEFYKWLRTRKREMGI